MHRFLEYTLLFAVAVLLQTLLFDSIDVGFYFAPFVYLTFVILLPVNVKGYLLLFLAAILGLVVDIFMGTPGINTMATVFMAYCRPFVLSLFIPRNEIPEGGVPNTAKIGARKFISYSAVMVLLHDAVFFALETMGAAGFRYTAARLAVSVVSSVAAIYFCQLFFVVKRSKI